MRSPEAESRAGPLRDSPAVSKLENFRQHANELFLAAASMMLQPVFAYVASGAAWAAWGAGGAMAINVKYVDPARTVA